VNQWIDWTRDHKAQGLLAGICWEITLSQAGHQNTQAADDQADGAEALAALFARHGVEFPQLDMPPACARNQCLSSVHGRNRGGATQTLGG